MSELEYEDYQKNKDRIWLEVAAVRREGRRVLVQLVGDREDREAQWWLLWETEDIVRKAKREKEDADKANKGYRGKDSTEKKKLEENAETKAKEYEESFEKAASKAADRSREIFDAKEKKRLVTAKLEIKPSEDDKGKKLYVTDIRIQSAESNAR